ncbi:unnamed protein product [Mytilus edulis]|uniref:Uncharacterized protein n=1 Tax=Mytilus edulis TaxID=6550 RepID=A0A8S3VKC6_MYTED|nr:unnamed protein product [Mytilus edulis]
MTVKRINSLKETGKDTKISFKGSRHIQWSSDDDLEEILNAIELDVTSADQKVEAVSIDNTDSVHIIRQTDTEQNADVIVNPDTESTIQQADVTVNPDTESTIKQADVTVNHDTESTIKQADVIVNPDTESTIQQADVTVNPDTESTIQQADL